MGVGGFFNVKGLSSLIEANCCGAVQEMALPASCTGGGVELQQAFFSKQLN